MTGEYIIPDVGEGDLPYAKQQLFRTGGKYLSPEELVQAASPALAAPPASMQATHFGPIPPERTYAPGEVPPVHVVHTQPVVEFNRPATVEFNRPPEPVGRPIARRTQDVLANPLVEPLPDRAPVQLVFKLPGLGDMSFQYRHVQKEDGYLVLVADSSTPSVYWPMAGSIQRVVLDGQEHDIQPLGVKFSLGDLTICLVALVKDAPINEEEFDGKES